METSGNQDKESYIKTKVPKKKINSLKIAPYVFIGPAVIYIFVVTVIPVILALPISFTDWSALSPKMHFIGFENYKTLIHDKEFITSTITMAKFFIYVPLVMLLGLILALLLNAKIKGITIFRVIFYSPVITSTIAAAVLFDWFFQPSFGLFNSLLSIFGIHGIGWISDAKTSVMSVIIFKLWKGAGVTMLIYLAGLQDVPQELKDAASIDGANWWEKFRYITFPLLRPANIYLLITQIIGVFMIFQETYMLQGPLKSTDTIVNYIYNKGFMSSEMGYASAMSFVLFVIVLTITIIQYKVLKIDAEYGGVIMSTKKNNNIILIIFLCLVSVLVIFPFLWMIFSSFKNIEEFYLIPPKILPKQFTMNNFKELFNRGNFGVYYMNSIFVTVIQVILNAIIVTMAGYGFAKYKFKGKKLLFLTILATTMVPWVATIIPLFIMAYKVHAIDSYFGLIFPGLVDAFSIFLAKNFMETIPTALIEAARIDGASEYTIFMKLVLPLTKPIIAVITIFKFVGSWNAFQWPLLVVNSDSLRTLPLAVAKFSSQYYDAYNLKMAAATLSIIPVLIVYIAFQKYFVSGISLSGMKD